MKTLELVIFDCDGVLVDSERIANRVFARVLNEECGFSLTLEDMFRIFVGHSSAQCMAIIEEMLGEPPPEHLEQCYRDEINAALAREVVPVAGIETVLDALDVPVCVASSGSHAKMRTTLGKTGLSSYFEGGVFSAEDVTRGKPHPDIYLHAAAVMGSVNPAACLVVEDSPLGVRGAVAAQMTVFGYAELTDPIRLQQEGAKLTFTSMYGLMDAIEAHFRLP